MVAQASLIEAVQAVVGKEHAFAPESDRFEVDGLKPQAVVEPGSYEEVAGVVRFANQEGLAVTPWGGGTKMHIGNVPQRYHIALSLLRLNQIIEYEPADMTVTCQAGTTAGAFEDRLAEHGQTAPFQELPSDECTIGGLLAANHSEQRAAYGAPRDFTVGMRVVTADGRITRTGGKVVKNVAGYDLCKLYIGSLGTLGVIVQATLKLNPLPQKTHRIEVEFDSIRQACALASDVRQRGLSVGDMYVRRFEVVIASFGLAGTPAAVQRSHEEIVRLAGDSGGRPPFQDRPSRPTYVIPSAATVGPPLAVTASVLPAGVSSFMEAIDSELPASPGTWIDPVCGIVGLGWLDGGADERLVRRVQQMVRSMGGTLLVRACSPELKRRIDVFGDPPPAFELMRRVKQQFDPKGILSPGRFVGRL